MPESPEPLVGFLHGVSLLSRLSLEELERLAASAKISKWPEGAVIFREGEAGDALYIVRSGRAEILKVVDGEEVVLAVHGPGGFFGEMALLEDLARSATARTAEPTELVEVSRKAFEIHLQENPRSFLEITRELSSRLRETDSLIIGLLQGKNRRLRKAYRELQQAQAELVRRERIKTELGVARRIVEDLLPRDFPLVPGWQFAARYLPAQEVGGDIYSVIPLEDGRLGLFMGDVSGKGIPAALYMAVVRGLLQAEAQRSPSPRRVLGYINRRISEVGEGSMFVTAVYGVLSPKNGELQYVRAGHEPPLLYHLQKRASTILEGEGTALGLGASFVLQERRVSLQRGDLLVFYTDGVTEASNRRGEFFGRERLKAVVEKNHRFLPERLCDNILREIDAFRGKAEQQDDIALLVVKVSQ